MKLKPEIYKATIKRILPEKVYNVNQVSVFLGVSVSTANRLRLAGKEGPLTRNGSSLYVGEDLIGWMEEAIKKAEGDDIARRIKGLVKSAPADVKITGSLIITKGSSKPEELAFS